MEKMYCFRVISGK